MNPRNTRTSAGNNLFVPRVNKHVFTQSVQYNGAKIWNSLPEHFKADIENLDAFKSLARRHFS